MSEEPKRTPQEEPELVPPARRPPTAVGASTPDPDPDPSGGKARLRLAKRLREATRRLIRSRSQSPWPPMTGVSQRHATSAACCLRLAKPRAVLRET